MRYVNAGIEHHNENSTKMEWNKIRAARTNPMIFVKSSHRIHSRRHKSKTINVRSTHVFQNLLVFEVHE